MENLNLSTEVGSIYYRYDEETENFDILRVITMQNTETFKCFRNNDINDIVKIPVKELKEDIKKLADILLNLKEIQNRSKMRLFRTDSLYGNESDRNTTFEIKKDKE